MKYHCLFFLYIFKGCLIFLKFSCQCVNDESIGGLSFTCIFQDFVDVHMSMAKVSGVLLLLYFSWLCPCPCVSGRSFECLSLVTFFKLCSCPCQWRRFWVSNITYCLIFFRPVSMSMHLWSWLATGQKGILFCPCQSVSMADGLAMLCLIFFLL